MWSRRVSSSERCVQSGNPFESGSSKQQIISLLTLTTSRSSAVSGNGSSARLGETLMPRHGCEFHFTTAQQSEVTHRQAVISRQERCNNSKTMPATQPADNSSTERREDAAVRSWPQLRAVWMACGAGMLAGFAEHTGVRVSSVAQSLVTPLMA